MKVNLLHAKKVIMVSMLLMCIGSFGMWFESPTVRVAASPQTYIYPFYVLWDVYNHDPVITITAFAATNYHVEQYNATTQAWEQKYPATGDKSVSAGELHVLTSINTGVPNEYKFCRVVSDQEVGINVLSLEGSVISAIATDGNYTGKEFILLGNAKGTFSISLHSSYKFRVTGFALQSGTTVNVYYKVKASPAPPPYDVTSFSVGESWTFLSSYSVGADQVWDTGEVTAAGASGDDIIAIKVTSDKPIIAFRVSTDNDEMDQLTSTGGTQFGKKLFFAMKCSFVDLSFRIWNRESTSASTTLYQWSAGAWSSVSTVTVPAKSMAIITTSASSDFWKLESDKEVACTYAAGTMANGRDQYWTVPSVSTPPAWTTFVSNFIYEAGPEPGYNGPGFQEFIANSDVEIDVTHTAAASDLSGTFNYKAAGTCKIIDNGVEKSLSISDSWNSMAVTNVTRFKLSAGSVLLWGISPLLSTDFTLTSKLWTFTGTTNFRFYKGGSFNCWIISINPTTMEAPLRNVDKKVYVELLRNGDFGNGLTHWMVRVEKGHTVQTYDGPTWLATRPLGPGWTDVNLINEVGRTNVLDIVQTVSDGDGDWTGAYQILNKDVSGFSELYFEADGKAMFQSLAGDGWVGGEYPVHFVITYRDVNGVDHDAHVGWPPNPAWQQGFYYLAGNLPDEPYSNKVTQNVWFHYKSPNLMNLSPAPKTIKTVRLYSSGWAYHGRIDNAQLYGTPPSAKLGDVIHMKIEVTVPSGETATVVDRLPSGCGYIDGTFTVDGVPATPTITKIGPPPSPPCHEISYTITETGTHVIEFDCKVDEAKSWTATEVCNIATAKWYDEAGELVETMEDVECFIIHAFEELDKNVGIPKKVKVIPAPVQFWREFIGGVTDIIVSDPPDWPDAVALVRDYAVLHKTEDLPEGYIPLELLTWEETQELPGEATWQPIDTPDDPCILWPGEVAEYDIYTDPAASAVLVRYTVAWASSQDVIEAHFINEAILESKSPQVIVGQLSNFDVHNDYHEPVDNFELELYGIEPSDIVDWFPGWGAPPQINPIPGGAEIIWMEPTQPVQPCEWVHFGLHLKPGVIATGIKAYWTQLDGGLVIKEKTNVQWRLEIEVTNPFPYTMTNVVITDRFGAEIEIDAPFPYSITHGTVSARPQGGSAKLFLTWNIGNLLPGETARLILLVSTDYNPGRGDCNEDNEVNILDVAYVSAHWTGLPAGPLGYDRNADLNYDGNVDIFDAAVVSSVWGQSTTGHQEYSEPGIYELNSGATLKFIDPEQDVQLSAYTDSIYVTVLPLEDP